jgi:hypothetical protein
MPRMQCTLAVSAALLATMALGAMASPASAPPPAKAPATKNANPPAPRTLDAIQIEGELDMPQVLFITARDQARYMDYLHRRYQKSCAEIGEEAQLPDRLQLTTKEK